MQVSLNNTTASIVLLTGNENIVTFDEPVNGTKANVVLAFSNNLAATVTGDNQYYITLLDETITNVMEFRNAGNRRFWISTTPTDTAASVAEALRNCPSIAAEWQVTQNGYLVYLTARRIGNKLGNYTYWQRTNIPNGYLAIQAGDNGSATTPLLDGKCNLQITNASTGELVARLSKQMYGEYTDFNISDVLNDECVYGQTTQFTIHPSTITNNGSLAEYSDINVYALKGYVCNGSPQYLTKLNYRILWNKQHNGSQNINYLYNNKLEYSLLTWATSSPLIYYRLYNSANEQIYEASRVQTVEGVPTISDNSFTFPASTFKDAYYAEIQVSNADSLRFEIIKPLNATEYFQRVYWRNEFGGIQFFDFTAQKSESYTVNQLTYNVNNFDKYRTDIHTPTEKIYSDSSEKVYTLTSHLMQREGKYCFDSLAMAKEIWTVIGDVTYHIIPTSVSVTENDKYNNIFNAQFSYRIV